MGGPAAARPTDEAFVGRLEDFRSLTPALRVVRTCLGITLVAAVLNGTLSLFATAVTGWAISFDPAGGSARLDAMDVPAGVRDLVGALTGLAAAAGVVLTLSVLVTGVSLIRWQTRALQNMTALGHLPRWPPAAAALAWFVPVWSLFAPKQTFDDLWRSSAPVPRGVPDDAPLETVRVPWWHGLWWGLWTGAVLLVGASALRMSQSLTLAGMLVDLLSEVVVASALAGAVLLLIRILRLTSSRQHARYAERAVALGWPREPPGI